MIWVNTMKNRHLLNRFDMKLLAVTTPMELEMVFNWHFMKNYLGVEQLEDGRHGASVKLDNGKTTQARGDQKIKYLGLGTWQLLEE